MIFFRGSGNIFLRIGTYIFPINIHKCPIIIVFFKIWIGMIIVLGI